MSYLDNTGLSYFWGKIKSALSGKQEKITAAGILKGDGAGGVSTAVPGTDYVEKPEVMIAVLTITQQNAEEDTTIYSCSKSVKKIVEAHKAGVSVFLDAATSTDTDEESQQTAFRAAVIYAVSMVDSDSGGTTYVFYAGGWDPMQQKLVTIAGSQSIEGETDETSIYSMGNVSMDKFLTEIAYNMPIKNIDPGYILQVSTDGTLEGLAKTSIFSQDNPNIKFVTVSGAGTEASPYTLDHPDWIIDYSAREETDPIAKGKQVFLVFTENDGTHDVKKFYRMSRFWQNGPSYNYYFNRIESDGTPASTAMDQFNVWVLYSDTSQYTVTRTIQSLSPPVTSVNGQTGAVTVRELPAVSASDNGKSAAVVNGAWAAVDKTPFYVNCTISGYGVYDEEVTHDKTYAEILAAYQAGRPCYAVLSNSAGTKIITLPLTDLNETAEIATFALTQMITGDVPNTIWAAYVTIDADGYNEGYYGERDTMPVVTASDNGKFMRVVDGYWDAVTVPDANGGSF